MHDGYKVLADAIIQQACEDFIGCHLKLLGVKRVKETIDGKEVWVYKKYRCKGKNMRTQWKRMIIDCVGFFTSEWFKYLKPNIDGNKLINTLSKSVDDMYGEFLKQQETKRQEKVSRTSLLWDGNTSGIRANH